MCAPVPLDSYDSAENAAQLRRHPWLALRRALQVVGTFGWFSVRLWYARQRWAPHKRPPAECELACARYLVSRLVHLGPTFIKVGQALSTRPDVLPKSYVHELARLQDRVPSFDTRLAIEIIEIELGFPLVELYSDFDPEPISAASIGQVYRARLSDGERVVVKVQRPNLPGTLAIDLAIVRLFAHFAQWRSHRKGVRSRPEGAFATAWLFGKDMPYVAIVDQFGKSLFDQTDFLLEGRNAERFNRNFQGFRGVRAPAVHWSHTTRRVITQERIDGVKFNDVPGIEHMGADFRSVVRLGVRAFVKQVLEDGFFHADTHPGNILVMANGDVVYIDWGMTDTIPGDLQLKLVDLFLHMVQAEYDLFVEGLVDLEMFPPDVDRRLLVPIIEDIYETQLGKRGRVLYSLGEIIDRLADVMYRYPFRLPERFSFLLRSVGTMEGVVLSVWPDFRFLELALPYAAKLMVSVGDPRIRGRVVDDLLATGRLDTAKLLQTIRLAGREATFEVGETIAELMRWLLTPDGARFRESMTDAVFSGEAEADCAAVIDTVLQADDFDPAPMIQLFAQWATHTSDGEAFLMRFAQRIGGLDPGSQLAMRFGMVLGRANAATAGPLLRGLLDLGGALAKGDPERLQTVVDWLGSWIEAEPNLKGLSVLARALRSRVDPQAAKQCFALAAKIASAGIDLRPLWLIGRELLQSPEVGIFCELALEFAWAAIVRSRADQFRKKIESRSQIFPL